MNVSLSPQTERLLQDRMKKAGFSSADDALCFALQSLEQLEVAELDDDTMSAIEEGLGQANRGEGRPWEEVRAELRSKYLSR
jgi:predicted transcriptional regulator